MKLFTKNTNKSASRQPRLMAGQTDDYVFRRSRTLTGTTSNKVAASAEHNSQLKTTRLQAHELHGHRQRITRLLFASLLVCAVLAFGIGNFIWSPRIVSQGAMPVDSAYQQSVTHYFKANPLQRFGLFFNPAQLEVFMLHDHSELKAFGAEVGLLNRNLRFTATFRQPVLVWEANGQRFFVDDTGTAFTYDHTAGNYVAVTDESGIQPGSDGSVASSRFIRFLGQLVGAVNRTEKGKVVAITIPASAREVDIKLEGREYPIKTHLDREVGPQAEDMSRALAWFDGRGIKPAYVDVRVAGRVFYK